MPSQTVGSSQERCGSAAATARSGRADNALSSAEDDADDALADLKAKYDALCHERAELKGNYERLTDATAMN